MNSYRAASIILFLLGGVLLLLDALAQLTLGTVPPHWPNTISTLLASIAAGVLSYGERK